MNLLRIAAKIASSKPSMKIEQIEALPVAGNHFQDRGIFDVIHEFMIGDHPVEEKIRALRKMDQVMGEENEVTARDVEEYLEESGVTSAS